MLYMNLSRLIFLKTNIFQSIIVAFLLLLCVIGCEKNEKSNSKDLKIEKQAVVFDYAQNVKMDSFSGGWLLEIMSKKWILLDKTKLPHNLPREWDSIPVISVPVERPVILSTSYLGYMRYLGVDTTILLEKKYVLIMSFYEFIKVKNIPNLE